MPLTLITAKQWDIIETIFHHRVPFDIYKKLQTQDYRELTRQHQKAIYHVWKDFIGESALVDQWLDDSGPDFTDVQQATIDANAITFLNRYKDLDSADVIELTAEIYLMPETSLTLAEWLQLELILDHRLPNGIYSSLDTTPYWEQTYQHQKAIYKIYSEMLGNGFFADEFVKEDGNDFDASQ